MRKAKYVISLTFILIFSAICLSTELSSIDVKAKEDENPTIVKMLIVKNGVPTILTGQDIEKYEKQFKNNKKIDNEILESENSEISTYAINPEVIIGPLNTGFYQIKKYKETGYNNEHHMRSKEKRISNIYENRTSVIQSATLSWNVNISWSVNISLSANYQKCIEGKLGANWTKSYNVSSNIELNVAPGKRIYITFYPIMRNSWGYIQTYKVSWFVIKKLVSEEFVDTYSPNYVYIPSVKEYSVDGVYKWIEETI